MTWGGDEGRDVLSTAGTRVLTGCDLQPVVEVEDALRDFGERYLARVYTPAEQRSGRTGGADSLAARFAAKEAVLKLLGRPDGLDLRCVEVVVGERGRPAVRLHGEVAELARRASLGPIDVSLSHAGGMAMAVAVALTGDPGGAPEQDEGQGE